jgi:hypothetical protein
MNTYEFAKVRLLDCNAAQNTHRSSAHAKSWCDVEFGLHVQAALNMALLSLLKDKVAKFDLAKQGIVL